MPADNQKDNPPFDENAPTRPLSIESLTPENTPATHPGCRGGIPINIRIINHPQLKRLTLGTCPQPDCGIDLLWRPADHSWMIAPTVDFR